MLCFNYLSTNHTLTMKRILYLLLISILALPSYAQMLFTENQTMTIDSAKTLQGSILPVLDFKTEKENVLTFKNTANINLLIKKDRVINVINKFEFSTYGKNITMSGGYIHSEYRYLLDHAFEVYPYIESQWAESRGMKYKVSTGMQSRYRLINTDHCLMFVAAGLFFEFEKWEHPETSVFAGKYAYSRSIKSHVSVSFKHKVGEHWELTTTAIHQGKPDSYRKEARFGGSFDLKYNITPTVGIRGTYRLIYDTNPIVEVRKDYNTLDVGLELSF